MDLWNPDFCKLFDIPIPEDVLSLVDEVPQTASDVVSQVHEPFSVIQRGAVENSTLPANSFAPLLPAMQVVQPKLPSSNVPLCSPHAHNAIVVPMPQKPTAKVGPPAKKECFASPVMSNKPKPPAKVTPPAIKQDFASPMSSNEIAETHHSQVHSAKYNMAVGLFNQWVQNQNQIAKEKRPCNLLKVKYPTPVVNYWLVAFSLEA